jgi:hypothetical protein
LSKFLLKIPTMGKIQPIMGKKTNTSPPAVCLADALFSKVRQRLLAVLFGAPERSFYMGELIALARSGNGAVQRELANLAAGGLLTIHKQSNQKHYQANPHSPVYAELLALVGKGVGTANVVRTALSALYPAVSAAFLHGEASRIDSADAPITAVLFGSDVDADAVSAAMQGAANTLGQQVRFTLYTVESISLAMQADDQFMSRLLSGSKTWLCGSEDQLFAQPS